MERLLWVCLGGAAGSGARYLLSGSVHALFGRAFPYGTLVVNVLGSFLIGVLMQLGPETGGLSPLARLALSAGVLGGFTTMSSFSYETARLFEVGAWGLAAANVFGTVALCLAATFGGLASGRWLVGP